MPTDTHKVISYRSTAIACYMGNIVQSVVINLTPILFIPLREQFGLSFQQLGFLILVNFITQVACDILFSNLIDKIGFRPLALLAHVLTVIGFVLFALSPFFFSTPYIGFLLATIIFSGAGGLLEVLLSPIINAIPTDEKAAAMSIMHSFYAWGQVGVIVITTFALFVFSRASWPWIVLCWSILPIANFLLFCRVPLAPPVPEEHRQGMRMLITKPFFLMIFLVILLGGAAENSIAQWTSAFMEKAVNLPKVVGDVGGMSMFALMLGLGRLLHGKFGARFDLSRVMRLGALCAFVCYIIVAVSPIPFFSLLACAACGFMVSLMWPGSLVLAAEKYPMAGSWMFAILACGGDIGCSLGPWLIGLLTDHLPQLPAVSTLAGSLGLSADQIGLRLGMLGSAIFPLGAFVCLLWVCRKGTAPEA